MPGAKAGFLGLAFLVLSACNGSGQQTAPSTQNASANATGQSDHLLGTNTADATAISSRSCPHQHTSVPYQRISVATTTATDTPPVQVGELIYRGGLHLTSAEPRFGGLSGLEVTQTGDSPAQAIAVSDNGLLVRFNLILDETGTLTGIGEPRISELRGENDKLLAGKSTGDAESLGLDPYGGIMIGFERDHRIGYVFPGRCQSSARVIFPTPLTGRLGAIASNKGLEALTFWHLDHMQGSDMVLTGLEMRDRGKTPLGFGPLYGPVDVGLTTANDRPGLSIPRQYGMTGMDELDGQVYALQRAYDPIRGNRINIIRQPLRGEHIWGRNPDEHANTNPLAHLKAPFPVDNFEGIAATRLPDGTVRLYIVSDDNFSEKQRTLLMAFDVLPGADEN